MTRDFRRRILADLRELPAERGPWFHIGPARAEVVGEQDSDDAGEGGSRSTADVYVFDYIGGWGGVSADDFVRDVAGLDVDHIDLHLNSPGGAAMEGIAIANVLRQHRADVTVWVDGIAASAASVIAMAGDEVVMGLGSQMMIHDASGYSFGDAATMRKAAEMLDSTSDAYASVYAAKAGGTADDWRAVMVEETWYTAEEAIKAGLANRLATDDDNGKASGDQIVPGSSNLSFWDMWDSLSSAERHAETLRALYAHAGRAEAPPPRMPAGRTPKTPAATASGSTHKERSTPVPFTDEHLTTMRTKLGLAADADEDRIVATVVEVMDEFTRDESASSALPEGAVAIDAGVLEQLRSDAASGRAAREQQQAERREQLVTAAIRVGRTTPAARDHWLNKLTVEGEVAEQQLASLAPGLVPVSELGHDTQPAPKEDLGWFDTVTTSQEG